MASSTRRIAAVAAGVLLLVYLLTFALNTSNKIPTSSAGGGSGLATGRRDVALGHAGSTALDGGPATGGSRDAQPILVNGIALMAWLNSRVVRGDQINTQMPLSVGEARAIFNGGVTSANLPLLVAADAAILQAQAVPAITAANGAVAQQGGVGGEAAAAATSNRPPQVPATAQPAGGSSSSQWRPYFVPKTDDMCARKFSSAGFTEHAWLYKPRNEGSSSMECFSSTVVPSSVCHARNIRFNPSLAAVSAGGEDVERVFNRREEDEFPVYSRGAFSLLQADPTNARPEGLRGFITDIVKSIEVSESAGEFNCDTVVETPTLFTTRYDYANMYHETTNLYNGWITLGVASMLEARVDSLGGGEDQIVTRPMPHQVVFLDGHAKGSLDSAWDLLFGPVTRMAKIAPNTCFKNAWFVPFQASSPIDVSYSQDQCANVPAVRQFVNFVHNGLQMHADAPPSTLAFILREDYLCHPRNPSGKTSRKIKNRSDVEAVLKETATPSFPNQYFDGARLSLVEQVQIMRTARVFMGLHGAGLMLALYMEPGTRLVEIQPGSHFGHQHFSYIARIAGVHYTEGSSRISLQKVGHEEYHLSPDGLRDFIRKLHKGS